LIFSEKYAELSQEKCLIIYLQQQTYGKERTLDLDTQTHVEGKTKIIHKIPF
jgi:hypothetical protein